MSNKKKQVPLNKLLTQASEVLNKYMWDERLQIDPMAKKANVSGPTLSSISKNKVKNISLNKLIQVINACGYNVVGIELQKAVQETDPVGN